MDAATIIALVALAFTGTQAWTARRKLKFDLFAKRFETWEAFNDAINERRARAPDLNPEDVLEADRAVREKIWRLERPMRALFPIDVSECIERIQLAMMDRDYAQLEFRHVVRLGGNTTQEEMTLKHSDLMKADQKWFEAQDELLKRVYPYIQQYGQTEIFIVQFKRSMGPYIKFMLEQWKTAEKKLHKLFQKKSL